MICLPEKGHTEDVEDLHLAQAYRTEEDQAHVVLGVLDSLLVAPQLFEGEVGHEGHHQEAHEQRGGEEGTQDHLGGEDRAGAAHHTPERQHVT